jgi:predicted MFS family arabinose efflux permease
VMLGFLGIAVVACVAFSMATTFTSLLAARVLGGVGVCACLMAPLTGFRRWLDAPGQLRANSWMLMTGSFGMLASTLPVQWLVPVMGWRPLFWGLAVCIAMSMVVIGLMVPGWQRVVVGPGGRPGSYAEVWKDPYFRRMMPIGFFSYGGMLAMQTLWAGPWLVRVAGYEPLQAAGGLFTINICMLATFLAWGALNPRLARRGITANQLMAGGIPLSLVALATIIVAGPHAGAWTWAIYCMSCTFVSLSQPAVGMAFPPALAGRALSGYNLVIFSGVFVVQWGVGLLIDGFEALGLDTVGAFRAAMTIFLACTTGAYGYFMLVKRDNRGTASAHP